MSDIEDKKSAVNLGRSRSIKRQKPDAPRKHVTEIISTDKEDESLRKYKLQLLGDFENLDIKSRVAAGRGRGGTGWRRGAPRGPARQLKFRKITK